MNNGKRLALFLASLLFTTSPSLAFAESEIDGVYARENAINVIGQSFQTFESERKIVAESEKGLKTLLKVYVKDSASWMEEYKKLAARLASTKDLSLIQQDISSTLRLQASRRAELNDQAALIRSKIEWSKKILASSIKTVDDHDLTRYQMQLAHATTALQNKLTKIQASVDVNIETVGKVREVFSFSFFYSKYLKAAIDQGLNEHAPQVTAFRSYLEGEIVAEQALSTIDALISKADRSMQRLEGQTLAKQMPGLNAACDEAQKFIQDSTLAPNEKSRVAGEVMETCNKTKTDYRDTILSFEPALLAKSMHNKNLSNRLLKKVCDKEGQACVKWKGLQSIPVDSVLKLDSEGILYLENQWQEIRSLQEANK